MTCLRSGRDGGSKTFSPRLKLFFLLRKLELGKTVVMLRVEPWRVPPFLGVAFRTFEAVNRFPRLRRGSKCKEVNGRLSKSQSGMSRNGPNNLTYGLFRQWNVSYRGELHETFKFERVLANVLNTFFVINGYLIRFWILKVDHLSTIWYNFWIKYLNLIQMYPQMTWWWIYLFWAFICKFPADPALREGLLWKTGHAAGASFPTNIFRVCFCVQTLTQTLCDLSGTAPDGLARSARLENQDRTHVSVLASMRVDAHLHAYSLIGHGTHAFESVFVCMGLLQAAGLISAFVH